MSKAEDDAIEATLRAEADRRRGATPPEVTLTGDQCHVASEAISDAIAELQRAHRTTKVIGDKRRLQGRIDGLSRTLGMINRSGGRS